MLSTCRLLNNKNLNRKYKNYFIISKYFKIIMYDKRFHLIQLYTYIYLLWFYIFIVSFTNNKPVRNLYNAILLPRNINFYRYLVAAVLTAHGILILWRSSVIHIINIRLYCLSIWQLFLFYFICFFFSTICIFFSAQKVPLKKELIYIHIHLVKKEINPFLFLAWKRN